MSTQLSNDQYGRTVAVETVAGQDIYTITNLSNEATFTVGFRSGTPQSSAYRTINSMPVSAPPLTTTQIYTAVVESAMDFGQQLMVQFAVANIRAGITQAGQTQSVMNYTTNLAQCLNTGSLYAAIADIETMIADTSSTKTGLSPFITNNILYSYLNQIQSYLNIAPTANPGS